MRRSVMSVENVRVDQWLCAARIFKSRTLAGRACATGHVLLNGKTVRSSHPVRVGDELSAVGPRGQLVLHVTGLAQKRLGAALARELYEDHSPPPPPRDEWMPRRPRGAGRPTKAERRALLRFRGEEG